MPTTAHEPTRSITALREGFHDPSADSAPMMRWWWFGPHVRRERLAEQLDTIAAAGFGGVEAAFVYPLQKESDSFMSESFLSDLRFAAEHARSRGMRFDLTLGSGWSFGGPHIDETTGARRIHWEQREVDVSEVSVPVAPNWPGDRFLGAYIGDGSIQEMPQEYIPLEVRDGALIIPRGLGPRVVLLAWSQLTGQGVKRASAGAEGLVFDHYSVEAAEAHLAAVCEPMLRAVPAELLGSVFCDSLEVYGANWSEVVPEEFSARRGYDPLPELWRLRSGSEKSREFRREYHQTLSELYEENFVARMRAWAQGHGVPFRIQSYGEPPAAISSYRAADLCEGEGWGWTGLTQTRWASSAARIYSRQVVSSEIWTWVHSPSLRATPLDLKGELHEHLLLGINHFIGHGWPYFEEDGEGLGWIFYAAGALDDRNPWWPAVRSLSEYIHRLSWLMRQGERIAPVGIYAPYGDVYAKMGNGEPHDINLWAGVKKHVGDDLTRAIRTSGHDFDLFDDDATEVLDPESFSVIVLPAAHRIPTKTRHWLRQAESHGTRVLRVTSSELHSTDLSAVAAEISAASKPPLDVRAESGTVESVGVVQRRIGDADVFFLANTGAEPQRLTVRPDRVTQCVERWDPESGEAVFLGETGGQIHLELEAYEAAVLVAHDERPDGTRLRARPLPGSGAEEKKALPIDEGWSVRFDEEHEPTPVSLPHRWEDSAERRLHYGPAVYAASFEWAGQSDRAVLSFGPGQPEDLSGAERKGVRGKSFRAEIVPPIGVAAKVTLNSRDMGFVWHPPYTLPLDGLIEGRNEVEITVYNVASVALSADQTVSSATEKSAREYGRRFRMQDLERADETVVSGLLAAPVLLVSREDEPGARSEGRDNR